MTESYTPENDGLSIDDALETDRVVAEGPDSRNADGFGVDEDISLGGDSTAAADQGNRDQDEMTAEDEDPEFEEIVRDEVGDGNPLG